MKKTIIITWLFLIGATAVWAQNASDDGGQGFKAEQAAQKIAALRKGYITDKLALTREEAEKFWPIYEEYKRKERALHQKAKRGGKKKPFDEMTEEEARRFVEKHLELEEARLALKKEYFGKMGAVIPMKKLVKLPRAEKSFKMEVMKRMKKQRPHHGPGRK